MKPEPSSSPGLHRNSLMSIKGVFWLLWPGLARSLQEVETINVQKLASLAHEGCGSLMGRAGPQRWLPPTLLGGLVSTGGESEVLS